MMDANELKTLLDKIFELPKVEQFAQGVAGILSYLKSEQDKRIELTKTMKELNDTIYGAKNQIGIAHQVNEINVRSEKNGKLSRGIVVGLVILIAGEVIRLIAQHVK